MDLISGSLQGDEVHVIGVEHAEGPDRDCSRRRLKPPQPLEGIVGHIGHDKGQVGLSRLDELAVVHGGGGHLGRGFDIGNVLGNDLGDPPAEDIINPAGSPGGHGEADGFGLRFCGGGEEEDENRYDEDP